MRHRTKVQGGTATVSRAPPEPSGHRRRIRNAMPVRHFPTMYLHLNRRVEITTTTDKVEPIYRINPSQIQDIMPALQRTPPQKAGKSPAKPYDRPAELIPEATASPARTPSKLSASATRPPAAAPTTPRAFLPWAQKVLRTPPDGMTASTSSMPPPPLPIQGGATTDIEELDNMDIEDVLDDRDKFVEEQITAGTSTAPRQSLYPTITVSAESQPLPISTETLISTTPTKSPQPRTSTTPVHSPPKTSGPTPLYPPSAEAGPSSQPAPATRASPPRTPRTRRTAAPVSIADPLPEIQVDETSEYGKRYELTMDTLQLAIKNAAMKWTCVSLFSACR